MHNIPLLVRWLFFETCLWYYLFLSANVCWKAGLMWHSRSVRLWQTGDDCAGRGSNTSIVELTKKMSMVGSESRIVGQMHTTSIYYFCFIFLIAHKSFLPIEKEAFRTGCDVTLSPLHCYHSNVQKVSLQFPVSRWGIPGAKRYVL